MAIIDTIATLPEGFVLDNKNIQNNTISQNVPKGDSQELPEGFVLEMPNAPDATSDSVNILGKLFKQPEPKKEPSLLEKMSQPSVFGPIGQLASLIPENVREAGILGPLGTSLGRKVVGLPFEVPQQLANFGQEQLQKIPQIKEFYQSPQSLSLYGPLGEVAGLFMKPDQRQKVATETINQIAGTLGANAAIKALPSIANNINKLVKYDNNLEQAKKAKLGLDTLRTTTGQAVKTTIAQVADVPTQMDWSIAKSPKIETILHNPIYGVEFDTNQKVVQNIGNLNKAKEAIGDLIGSRTPAWLESAKKEKDVIKSVYFGLRDEMVRVAAKKGVDLATPLDTYHKFMLNYNRMNPILVDKTGQAIAKKMVASFRMGAEPGIKETWQNLAKVSPEIKEVMNSMNKRLFLKKLLQVAEIGAGGAAALGVGKQVLHIFNAQEE